MENLGAGLSLAGQARARSCVARSALLAVALAIVAVVASAGTAQANTPVSSNITTNTTWTTAGSPYDINATIKVASGVTLTIQPGVTVDFNAGTVANLTVQGTIKAEGTAGSPIVFTSHQALEGSGSPGQYQGVHISSGNAASRFSYTDFFYGGSGSGGFYAYAVLTIASSSIVAVEHSVFEHNAYSGVTTGVGGGLAKISYSLIAHNGGGVTSGGTSELQVTHSTIRNNSEDGAHLILGSAPGDVFNYDEITENERGGVRIQQSCTSALSTFAHGEYNNISNNGEFGTSGRQLITASKCKALPVDWRNNYWGPQVYYHFNDFRCASGTTPYPGHLAYYWSIPEHEFEVPAGPIYSDSASHSETVEKKPVSYGCAWDTIKIGPGEFLTSPLSGAGATPGSVAPEPPTSVLNSGASEAAPNLNTFRCADPVNCVTGNFFETYRDLSIPGLDGGLSLSRTYNSQPAASGTRGPFGYGWSSTFSQTLSFDPSGEAATVTNADGSVIVFTKTAEGAFTAPAWVQATLVASGENFIYTLPNQRAYTFSSAGRLLKVSDRNGNASTLAYNETGRLETVTGPGGRKLTFAYNSEGLIETVKDPVGHVVKYAYEGGTLASVTQPGEASPRWRYKYDALHEMTTITDGRGGETLNEYDSSGRVISQTDRLKHKTTWTYASNDTRVTAPTTVTDVQFAENLPTQVTRAYGTASAASTKYEYDANDNLVKVIDPNGHATRYEYDGEGNRIKMVDADEDTTKWTYDSKHDMLTVTTPRGETTTIKRDAHGNAEAVERPAPAGKTQVTKYKYDSQGRLEQLTDPLAKVWKYEYDSYGDRTAAVDPEGARQTYAYDEDSHETSSVSPRGNVEGAEASKYTTKVELDAQERPIKITDPLGNATKYAYDANGKLETLTDANGHTTAYTYDADDELTKVKAPSGAIAETTYDEAGRVAAQIDGNKHTTKYQRNPLGEVVEVTDALGRKTAKEYDKAGNLTSVTDAAKRTTTYKYDPANRLIEVDYSSEATPDVKYEYDPDGSRTQMVDGTGTSKYTYDQLDRLTESKDGHGDVVGYEYDLANEQTKIIYPSGKAVTRAYDDAGRLKSVTDWLEHTTKFGYNADSGLTTTNWPSGSGEEDKYSYDDADRLTKIEMNEGAESLASLTYTRDSDGQLKTVAQTGLPGEAETSYTYDEDGRLTKAALTAYEYDGAGNPTKLGASANEYDAADELTTSSSVTYSYDELGERTRATPGSGPATTYGYDQASDLTSVARPHEGEVSAIEDSYGYDGDGLRASQTISGTTSYMSWDAADALPLLLSDGTSVFIYGSGGLPIEQVSGETVQYLHHDQQGSTRMITAAAGTVAGATTFDAYGNKLASTGSATTALGYDGQYTSADTGLIYLRARVYDSASAQFLSRDPLEAFTREAYGYAGSDPVNRLDRSGLSEEGEHPCPPGALCLPPPPNPIKAGEELVTGVAEGAGKTWGGIKTLWNDVTGANDAEEDGEGPGIPASEECELVQTPAPPGFDPDAWTKGPASRPSDPGENYYDPEGGEWNYHPPDKYHDTPHWNYKPPTPWNAEWKNIYP